MYPHQQTAGACGSIYKAARKDRKDTFGAERLDKIFQALKTVADEYHIAFTNDKEADYYQEMLDRQIRDIWGDKTMPFYERYPELKKVRYDKAMKGWK